MTFLASEAFLSLLAGIAAGLFCLPIAYRLGRKDGYQDAKAENDRQQTQRTPAPDYGVGFWHSGTGLLADAERRIRRAVDGTTGLTKETASQEPK